MVVLLAFQDEEPEKLTVAGTLAESKVDDSAFLTLSYSNNRVGGGRNDFHKLYELSLPSRRAVNESVGVVSRVLPWVRL